MRITLIATLITIIDLIAVNLPCAAQYYNNSSAQNYNGNNSAPYQNNNGSAQFYNNNPAQFQNNGGSAQFYNNPAQYQNNNASAQFYNNNPAQYQNNNASAQFYNNNPAQYVSNNSPAYRNRNTGSYTGFGGRPNPQMSGLHGLAQPTGSGGSYRSSTPQHSPAPSSMQNFERALNAIDTPQAWSRTPVAVPPTRSPSQANPYGSMQASAPSGMLPRVTRRDVARVMMEGGSLFDGGNGPSSSGSSEQSVRAAAGTTYSSYQRAENAASRAHSAASRARYDNDKWSKKNAANDAYYAANDARKAADDADRSAAKGDSQARAYASQARGAANRARADADRARYNAETEYH